MMLRKRSITTTLKVITVILVLHNEFLTYILLPFNWPTAFECTSPDCIKILLVADAQILGRQGSSRIEIWDSDRYLAKTFSYAIHFTKPDVIIFLGDQMDEGHIASDAQFNSDLKRFHSIFYVPDHFNEPTVIYVPGDNDIGGEGDPIVAHSVHRFDRFFDQSAEPINYQNILEFYKINKMTVLYQEPETLDDSSIRIGLSHMPILRKIHTISKQVATSVKPHLILSGHDHDSVHVTAPLSDVWKKTIESIVASEGQWLRFKLRNETVHELIAPTCSYRMGMVEMGYGYAQIETKSWRVSYAVLWLPGRLTHLLIYLGFLVVVTFIFSCFVLVSLHHRLRRLIRNLFSTSLPKQPLLIP